MHYIIAHLDLDLRPLLESNEISCLWSSDCLGYGITPCLFVWNNIVCMSCPWPPAPHFIFLFLSYPSSFIYRLYLGDFHATAHPIQFGVLLFLYFFNLLKIHIFVNKWTPVHSVKTCGLNGHMASQTVHHKSFELVSIHFHIKLTRQK